MFMKRHHEVALNQALDQLYLDGATTIRWDQLYLWLGAERLSKGSYREIHQRWEDLCVVDYKHVDAPPLFVLGNKHRLTITRGAFAGEKVLPLADWM